MNLKLKSWNGLSFFDSIFKFAKITKIAEPKPAKFSLKRKKGIEDFKSHPLPTYMVWAAFSLMFIYGAMILMIGYTQGPLSNLLFPGSSERGKYMVYLLASQSLGLIVSTVVTAKLIKHINIRWIFTVGFGLSVVALFIIAYTDKIIPSTTNSAGRAILFGFLSFIMGVSIGPVSPLVSTLISAVYTGQKRATMLSVSNGIYGIGAGIVPLAASKPIINLGSEKFAQVRYFYFIAAVLAILGAVIGFWISYRHSKQKTSATIIQKGDVNTFSLLKPLILVLLMLSGYMIAESVSNYMFANVSKAYDPTAALSSTARAINANQAFGLFVMIQGLWRAGSGLTVTKKMRNATFIYASVVIIIAAYAAMLGNALEHVWGMYVVAVLLGFGLGNTWPIIFSYCVSIDPRRSSFIGMADNITSMAWIPVTQVIAASLWAGKNYSEESYGKFFAVVFLGLAGAVMIPIFLTIAILYFKNKNIKTQ